MKKEETQASGFLLGQWARPDAGSGDPAYRVADIRSVGPPAIAGSPGVASAPARAWPLVGGLRFRHFHGSGIFTLWKWSSESSLGGDSCSLVSLRVISEENALWCAPARTTTYCGLPASDYFFGRTWSDLVGLPRPHLGLPRRSLAKAGRAVLPQRPD